MFNSRTLKSANKPSFPSNIDLAILSSTQGLQINGAFEIDVLGDSIDAVDFNGDGCDDLLIGASNASPQGRKNAGICYVIWGGKNISALGSIDMAAMTLTQGIRIDGAANGDNTGRSVSSAGDFNNDGHDDILIGAIYASPKERTNAGLSYVLWGGKNFSQVHLIDLAQLTPQQGLRIEGAAQGDLSGAVSGAGDVNGDGCDDILIGAQKAAPQGRSSAGITYLLWGNSIYKGVRDIDLATLITGQGLRIEGAAAEDYSGFSLSNAGNFNGDQYSDILIGAASPSGRQYAGINYLLWGEAKLTNITVIDLSTLNASQGIRIEGAAPGIHGGIGAGIGDVNGDNFDDILIGAVRANPQQREWAGTSFLIWGNPNISNIEVIDLAVLKPEQGIWLEGAAYHDSSGASVGGGDINDDGINDILIGAPWASPYTRNQAGKCYVIWDGIASLPPAPTPPLPPSETNIFNNPIFWIGSGSALLCLLTTIGLFWWRRSHNNKKSHCGDLKYSPKKELTSIKNAEQTFLIPAKEIKKPVPQARIENTTLPFNKYSNENLHLRFQLKLQDIMIDSNNVIGVGGHGKVFKGKWLEQVVAIKEIELQDRTENNFHKEAKILAQLNHPNIVRLYGVCVERKPYYMVMEYMPKGSLNNVLQSQIPLDWSLRQKMVLDIGCGLSYLHSHNPPILHRDLKSLNVLLDQNFNAKICDFGLTQLKQEITNTNPQKAFCSVQWAAPEVFAPLYQYTEKSDIYSYGMVLWEIASRKFPFQDAPNVEIIPSWIKKGEREQIPKDTPASMALLISRCWKDRSQERPTIDEAIKIIKKENFISNASNSTTDTSFSGYRSTYQPSTYRS